jgi:drug/metabolite transporter (DMT)-like permease
LSAEPTDPDRGHQVPGQAHAQERGEVEAQGRIQGQALGQGQVPGRAEVQGQSEDPPQVRARKGILLVVVASLMFATLDGLMKFLTERYSPLMLGWARHFFHMLVILLIFGPSIGRGLTRTRRPLAQFARGCTLALSAIFFFNAVALQPLAEITGIFSIAPVLVTVAAVLVLGERAPRGTAWALALSFIGVLLIVRPGGGIFGLGAVLALLAALSSTAFALLTRSLARSDDTMATLFIGALIATLLLSLLLPFVWQNPLHWTDVAIMLLIGSLGAGGHLLLLRAYRIATVSTLAPFSYAHTAFALPVGLVLFGHFPDLWSLAGITLIVATGVAMAMRRQSS